MGKNSKKKPEKYEPGWYEMIVILAFFLGPIVALFVVINQISKTSVN